MGKETNITKRDLDERYPFMEPMTDRLFDEERMYTYVKTYCKIVTKPQTIKALPYAREYHKNQLRKGIEKVPYINHPLLMACHALALGIDDDDVLSTILLHDVCEDCEVKPEELPFSDSVKEAVALLTKDDAQSTSDYYCGIATNKIATIVKLLDRCNNISTMASAYTKRKLVDYINETECYIYPLLETADEQYVEWSDQIFLIKYHIKSVMATVTHLLIQ